MTINNSLRRRVFSTVLLASLSMLGMVSHAWAAPCTTITSARQTSTIIPTSHIGEDWKGSAMPNFPVTTFTGLSTVNCSTRQDVKMTVTDEGGTLLNPGPEQGSFWLDDGTGRNPSLFIQFAWKPPGSYAEQYPTNGSQTIDDGYPQGQNAGPTLTARIYTQRALSTSSIPISKTYRVSYYLADPDDPDRAFKMASTVTVTIKDATVTTWSCELDPSDTTQNLGAVVLNLSKGAAKDGYYEVTDSTRGTVNFHLNNCNTDPIPTSGLISSYSPRVFVDVYAPAANLSPTDNTVLLPNSSSTTKGLGFRFTTGSRGTVEWFDLSQRASPLSLTNRDIQYDLTEPGSRVISLFPYFVPLGDEPPEPGIMNGTLFFRIEYY